MAPSAAMPCSNTSPTSSPPPICRSAPTSKTASATRRRPAPKPSGSPPQPASPAAPSRTFQPRPAATIYAFEHAVERVRAAAEAAHALPAPFVLTARAENFIAGNPDLADTIRRLQAFQEAGADVLYAPGLKSKEDIAAVLSSVDRPLNVVMGLSGVQLDLATLSAMGVKRISVGSSLSRVALTAFLRAAQEMQQHGTFTFGNDLVPYKEINDMFEA